MESRRDAAVFCLITDRDLENQTNFPPPAAVPKHSIVLV